MHYTMIVERLRFGEKIVTSEEPDRRRQGNVLSLWLIATGIVSLGASVANTKSLTFLNNNNNNIKTYDEIRIFEFVALSRTLEKRRRPFLSPFYVPTNIYTDIY